MLLPTDKSTPISHEAKIERDRINSIRYYIRYNVGLTVVYSFYFKQL
jgi:hypothetical protein